MKRTLLTASLVAFTALAAPVAAQDAAGSVQDAIVAQLTGQGFTLIRIQTTLLGRVRIVASAPGMSREIIFNPRTGEILRDYWDDEDDDDGASGLLAPAGSSGSGGDDNRDRRNGNGDDSRDDGSDDGGDDSRDDGGDDSRDDGGGDDDHKDKKDNDKDKKDDDKDEKDDGKDGDD